jgi:hypothetical protein
MPKGNIYSQSP